jgi:uncharacterized protein (DUF58 family)
MGVPLNVDIPGSVAELRDAMKDFALHMRLYRILLKGKALEFEGYRTFESDDDAQTIDWKASMRANRLMVKQYREERNVKILFAVDVGEHMIAGSSAKLKCEYMTEAAAALGHLILASGDKLGLVLYNDRIRDVILPKGGETHFQYFADILSDSATYGGGSRIETVLDFLIDYIDTSVKGVILMSDFIHFPNRVLDKLQIVGRKFETFAIMIKDPMDKTLPDVSGEVVLEDPFTGQQLLVNPKMARKSYERYAKSEEERVGNIFKKSNIDLLSLTTDTRFVPMLAEFLRERIRQKGAL